MAIERCRVLRPDENGKLVEHEVVEKDSCRELFWEHVKSEELNFFARFNRIKTEQDDYDLERKAPEFIEE